MDGDGLVERAAALGRRLGSLTASAPVLANLERHDRT